MLSKGTKFFDTHKSFPFTFLTEPATTTIYWTLSIRKQSTYVARKKIGILEKTKDSGEVPEAGLEPARSEKYEYYLHTLNKLPIIYVNFAKVTHCCPVKVPDDYDKV